MNSFLINFLKLLRNSTAMTLLFLPAVSAMQDDSEVKVPSSSSRRIEPSSSGEAMPSSSTSSSLGFKKIPEEEIATELRNFLNLGEPDKLFLLGGRRFIKGEVPGDGTCFIHTLNMLFPDRGISRDEFAVRLSSAFLGENPSVSSEELRREFAAELYTQLFQFKLMEAALEFKGDEINKFADLLNSKAANYLESPENVRKTIQKIIKNDKIIKEMLVCFAQKYTMLSLPAAELGNIGSFGLACKLFSLNLDVYSPIGKTNNLELWKEFRFGKESPTGAAFFAHAHVSPLCLEGELETRKRFAENEVDVMMRTYEISSQEVSGSALQSDPLSFIKNRLDVAFGSYLSSRLRVGTSAQYGGIYLPQAPVVHPYTMSAEEERTNFGVPSFAYAARLSAEELNPNLFPVFSKTQEILRDLGIHLRDVEYFYVVQHDPWNLTKRLLRPQYWLFPDVPSSSTSIVKRHENIKVEISSPNNAITLTGPSEKVVSSHNAVSKENPNGDPLVVSSGPDFPMLSGMKANQTSFFVSTVVVPRTKKAAVTFHTILSDNDFELLQTATLNNLSDLQFWLAELYQSKSGAISDSSSPYSSWTTVSLPHLEEAIPMRTPGKITVYGEGIPPSELSFPGDYKLADTLKGKQPRKHPLSVTPGTDEIKGDEFNYYFTVPKDQMARLNGATLQFQVEMKSNAPAYIEYWDGLKEVKSTPHSGSDQWETLTVEFTVNSEKGRWFNFYPAILPAVEGIGTPSAQIRNCILYYKNETSNSSSLYSHRATGVALASTPQVSPPSSSIPLPHLEEATFTRTPGKITVYGDGVPPSELSFSGDYKLADTLKGKQPRKHPLSVTPGTDEIKGDEFNYYFTVPKDQMARLNAATLIFQVEMKSNAPAYIEYWDGLKEMKSTPHSGKGQWETLTVEFTVNFENGRWFNFYPAILPAVNGAENPSTQIRNCILRYKK